MKRIVCIMAVCMALAPLSRAEVTHSLGVQFGFNQQLYRLNTPTPPDEVKDWSTYKNSKTKLGKDILNGLKLGLVYDVTYVKGFGNFFAFNYVYGVHDSKWAEFPYDEHGNPTGGFPSLDVKSHDEMHTLELNIDFQYKFEIAKQTWLILYTGPTVQYRVHHYAKDFFRGHLMHDDKYPNFPNLIFGYSDTEDMHYFHDVNVLWGLGAGFQYKRYYLRGGYDFGLMNPYKSDNFGEMGYKLANGNPDDRLTRGRIDQWNIRIGIYFWQSDN